MKGSVGGWIAIAVLLGLWALGMMTDHVGGGAIYLLLAVAVVGTILRGRRGPGRICCPRTGTPPSASTSW